MAVRGPCRFHIRVVTLQGGARGKPGIKAARQRGDVRWVRRRRGNRGYYVTNLKEEARCIT